MKISASEVRVGNLVEHQNKLWRVLKKEHVKPGKGGAFLQLEMKELHAGTKLNERFRSEDKIEKAFNSFLVAYEEIIKEDNGGKNKKATRTRQAVTNKGIKKTIEDLAKSRTLLKGFMRLMDYNMPEATLEHLVVENYHDFSEGVVDSALEKLADYEEQ